MDSHGTPNRPTGCATGQGVAFQAYKSQRFLTAKVPNQCEVPNLKSDESGNLSNVWALPTRLLRRAKHPRAVGRCTRTSWLKCLQGWTENRRMSWSWRARALIALPKPMTAAISMMEHPYHLLCHSSIAEPMLLPLLPCLCRAFYHGRDHLRRTEVLLAFQAEGMLSNHSPWQKACRIFTAAGRHTTEASVILSLLIA